MSPGLDPRPVQERKYSNIDYDYTVLLVTLQLCATRMILLSLQAFMPCMQAPLASDKFEHEAQNGVLHAHCC